MIYDPARIEPCTFTVDLTGTRDDPEIRIVCEQHDWFRELGTAASLRQVHDAALEHGHAATAPYPSEVGRG